MKNLILAFVCIFYAQITLAQESTRYAESRIIVKFKVRPDEKTKNSIIDGSFLDPATTTTEHIVESIKLFGNKKKGDTYLINFVNKQDIMLLVKQYQSTGCFEFVEPDYIGRSSGKRGVLQTIPTDTYFERQYGLYNDGSVNQSTVDADIDMDLAWDIEQGDESVIVAILDTGIKLDHPEFEGRVWENVEEIINGIDDDNNGYIDDVTGWDFVNEDNHPVDDEGHGTNVAGIAAANGDNDLGYAGVDWNCKLMICKITNDESWGFYSWWTEAIYYAVDNGVKVINMSVGGTDLSLSMRAAVNYAYGNGVTIVASMMNENTNVVYYPAGYDMSIAVGATSAEDKRCSPQHWGGGNGSNYGSHIDVVAPGNNVYGLNYESNTDYSYYWSGTSQAAPHVTGLCALLLAQAPERSPTDLRTIIRATAEDQVGNLFEDTPGFDQYYGYGRVNAYQALLPEITSSEEATAEDLDLLIFPNPASKELLIDSKITNSKISIRNVLGTEVIRRNIGPIAERCIIDISFLPKGLYNVTILGKDSNVISTEKIVIN